MSGSLDARQLYWVAYRCPACASLVRASTVLRAWETRSPGIETLALVTRSGGPGKIENLRSPLEEFLRSIPREKRYETSRRIDDFFSRLERRVHDGASEVRAAAARLRYL